MTTTRNVLTSKICASDELARYLHIPSSRRFPRLKKGQPITARRVDEMEVRLPLTWKSHPSSSILILRLLSTGVFFSLVCPIISSYFSSTTIGAPSLRLFRSFPLLIASSLFPNVRPLNSRSSPSRFPLPSLSLFLSLSLSFSLFLSLPVSSSLFPPSPLPCQPRRNSLSWKKREKDAKNRCAMPVGHSWLRSCPYSSTARSWAWLKDELSLCHRLYWSYTIRCVRSIHRYYTYMRDKAVLAARGASTGADRDCAYLLHIASRHLQRMHYTRRAYRVGWKGWESASARCYNFFRYNFISGCYL